MSLLSAISLVLKREGGREFHPPVSSFNYLFCSLLFPRLFLTKLGFFPPSSAPLFRSLSWFLSILAGIGLFPRKLISTMVSHSGAQQQMALHTGKWRRVGCSLSADFSPNSPALTLLSSLGEHLRIWKKVALGVMDTVLGRVS